MVNPRSLILALYEHWPIVEACVRFSREYPALGSEQIFNLISKISPQLDANKRGGVLRSLVNADILQTLPRSEDLQLNGFVIEFVRSLTKEHELGLASVLQARIHAIREANESLNEALIQKNTHQIRESSHRLSELFRQITLQLEQDKHAILDLVENAKASESNIPITQRYDRVLKAYDQYIEPMNQMMDSGSNGIFYHHLEQAEQSLDLALEQLSVQGALYSHRLQLRQISHQVKELRRFGRTVALHCADILLPLREELRQHNQLSSAISQVLKHVRKKGLRRTFNQTHLPIWRSERKFKLHVGDEIRTIMADARDYQPQAVVFPEEDLSTSDVAFEYIDEALIRADLKRSLPVHDLLLWLTQHVTDCSDATLLRLFHDLQHETQWFVPPNASIETLVLQDIVVSYHPHHVTEFL